MPRILPQAQHEYNKKKNLVLVYFFLVKNLVLVYYLSIKNLVLGRNTVKRKIYETLLEWKNNSQGKSAVMIDGARRTGKSYIAEEFAKHEYKSYILIDFYKAPDEIKDIFKNSLNDLDSLFVYLSTYYGKQIFPRETLFVFDEVQFCPAARAAIKYLVQDGRYDFLETGSLVSIHKNMKDILIPSEEEHIRMNPMDFEEFLWALGDETLFPYIKKMFEQKKPMGDALHRKAMSLFRQYLIVGGMPQAVEEYVQSKDFTQMDKIKRNILELYKGDIAKYANGQGVKVRRVFDYLPSELSLREKRIKLSDLDEGSRSRDYEDAFSWLIEARIVNPCFNTTEPNIGLRMKLDREMPKLYLGDTGLLISLAFDESGLASQEIYKKLMFDKLEVNEGMFFENIVAQMLVATNHQLYFYSNNDRNNCELRMEVDFLVAKSKITSRHNVSPIEVKSTKNYTLNSLLKYKKHFDQYTDKAYVIHTLDLAEKDEVIYLPVYMTPLL